MAEEKDLDTPVVEPSSLFYKSEEVEPDLEEITEDVTPIEPAEEITTEAEELESEEQEQLEVVDNDNRIVDIDGREVSVQQILDWEKNGLMQSDYTRKRQADAEAKRVWEADKQKEIDAYVTEKHTTLNDSIAMMETLIKESDETIDWDDLREFDPSEYLKQKELKDKRLDAVEKAKKEASIKVESTASPEYIEEQQTILKESNPGWLKDGKATEAYTQDMKMLNDYMLKTGYNQADNDKIVDAKHWMTMLDAARYRQSQKKVEAVKDKVKKLPITTKPKKTVNTGNSDVVDLFYKE